MAQPAHAFPLSEERIYDSSDENEVNSSADQYTLKSVSKTGNGAAENGDGDMEETSDSEEEKTAEDKDESEDSQAASDKESAMTSASSGKSESSPTPEPATPEPNISKAAIPPKTFKAPKGFEPVALTTSGHGFDESSTTMIWIISAPSDVPVDAIKELNVDAVMRGDAVVTHNGVAYGMQPVPHGPETSVIDRASGGKYEQVKKKVERSFVMREISTHVKSPSAAGTPAAFTATQAGKPREPRKQPEGLKPRYSPFGAGPQFSAVPDAEPDADVEMAEMSDSGPPKTTSRKQGNENKSAKKRKRD